MSQPWTPPGPALPPPAAQFDTRTAGRWARNRALKIMGAIFLVIALLLGGLIGWVWWDHQNQVGWVQKAPNEGRLVESPSGPAPLTVGNFLYEGPAPYGIGSGYRAIGSTAQLVLTIEDTRYWDAAVRGDGRTGRTWTAAGDLLCQDPGHATSFCVMKFSDGAMVVQGPEMDARQMAALVESYIGQRQGETAPEDWHGVTPPNLDRLQPVTGLADKLLGSSVPGITGQPIAGQQITPHHAEIDWIVLYGGSQIPYLEVTGYTSHAPWAYAVQGRNVVQIGDAVCTGTGAGTLCALAGSDGMVIATGIPNAETIAGVLNGLV